MTYLEKLKDPRWHARIGDLKNKVLPHMVFEPYACAIRDLVHLFETRRGMDAASILAYLAKNPTASTSISQTAEKWLLDHTNDPWPKGLRD